MRILLGHLVALASFCLLPNLMAQPTPNGDGDGQVDRIGELIQNLNDDRFSVRRSAETELLKLGEPALKALQEMARSDDNERRIRARRLLRRLMLTLTRTSEASDEALKDVTSIAISSCGRYAYTAAYSVSAVSFFTRDTESGTLSHKQTIADPMVMAGAVSLRLSPDRRKAVAACFVSKSVVLFRINPNTGTLDRVDVSQNIGPDKNQQMSFTIEAIFSTDSKFVYALDPNYGDSGAVIAFRAEDDTLKWVQTNTGENDCFQGARGISCHPDGKWMYVTSDGASTLTVLARDGETGKTHVHKTYNDDTDGIRGLGGAFSVACSPDGRFVYTSSGRFQGDDSIGVFKVREDGLLSLVQEIQNGENDLDGFKGGNEILVTPDGKYVYAAATRSSMVAGFQRDADTGRLTVRDTESIDLIDPGSEGPAGLGISPEGDHLYVAAESPGKVIVFRRRSLE